MRKNFKKKYQGCAHVGQEWDSSDEDEETKKKGMATLAMAQFSSSACLFNNISDDEDNSHFCLMARVSKVQESSTSSCISFSTPKSSDELENLDDGEN
jgi:hypothetical protein